MLDVPFRSARQLAADIKKKRIGCLELLELYLATCSCVRSPAPRRSRTITRASVTSARSWSTASACR